jgi:hypothetical protein
LSEAKAQTSSARKQLYRNRRLAISGNRFLPKRTETHKNAPVTPWAPRETHPSAMVHKVHVQPEALRFGNKFFDQLVRRLAISTHNQL